MDTIIKTQIIDLIHREVIPAIGCTEPIAVALAAAKAAEVLGRKPEKIEVYLSANILKNAMGLAWWGCLSLSPWDRSSVSPLMG